MCKSPPLAPRRPAAKRATPQSKVAHPELTATDYGLPEGTAFIDTFKKDHGFLSNFAKVPIEFEGEIYPSVEHAFQAAKTDVPAERATIQGLGNPLWARQRGKNVTLRPGWDAIRLEVMQRFLRAKFAIPKMADKLLATGDTPLYEGNWWDDRFWGTVDGKGDNHLGVLLMEIRTELRSVASSG